MSIRYSATDEVPIPAGLRIDHRYYQRHLDEEGRRLYRFMVECISAHRMNFLYVPHYDPATLPEECHGLPTLEHGDRAAADVLKVYEALSWDFPEFYYMLPGVPYWFSEYGHISAETFSERLRYSDAEIARLDRKLDKIYHHFDKVATGYALELAVNDYLIREYSYAHKTDSYRGKKYNESFNVVGLLKRGEAVCAGLTRMAQYIFQRRGMEVAVIITSPPEDVQAHCWLAVNLEGRYYHLDITFNESNSLDGAEPQYMTFNLTDREIMEHSPYYDPTLYPDIVCRSHKDNYYYREGLYFKTQEALTASLKAYLDAHRDDRSTYYYHFRVPRRMSLKRTCIAMGRAIRGRTYLQWDCQYCDGHFTLEFRSNEPTTES